MMSLLLGFLGLFKSNLISFSQLLGSRLSLIIAVTGAVSKNNSYSLSHLPYNLLLLMLYTWQSDDQTVRNVSELRMNKLSRRLRGLFRGSIQNLLDYYSTVFVIGIIAVHKQFLLTFMFLDVL